MSNAWKELDLEGKGVQSVNKRFVSRQKTRSKAYLLWLLFPLGIHRIYLNSGGGALLYSVLSALCLILFISTPALTIWPLGVMLLFAFFDLLWIDRQLNRINKQLRIDMFLQQDRETAPPQSYKGKFGADHDELIQEYNDIKDREIPADKRVSKTSQHDNKRIPSFEEQETLLRQMAKYKRPSDKENK